MCLGALAHPLDHLLRAVGWRSSLFAATECGDVLVELFRPRTRLVFVLVLGRRLTEQSYKCSEVFLGFVCHAFEEEEASLRNTCLYGGGTDHVSDFLIGVVEEKSWSIQHCPQMFVLERFQPFHRWCAHIVGFHSVKKGAGYYRLV